MMLALPSSSSSSRRDERRYEGGGGGASCSRKLSLSLPREHELPLRKFYSITLVFILPRAAAAGAAVHFGVVGVRCEADGPRCCGRKVVIFLMNLNGLVAVTHFAAEEERSFESNDD